MSRYHVKQSDVIPYSPANHTGTRNYRMICADTVGAKNIELVIGEVERNAGALPHAHPGLEQVCFMLEGEADVEVGGEKFVLRPGESCFFPAEAMHVFTARTPKVKVIVIYTPPYGEDPKKVIR